MKKKLLSAIAIAFSLTALTACGSGSAETSSNNTQKTDDQSAQKEDSQKEDSQKEDSQKEDSQKKDSQGQSTGGQDAETDSDDKKIVVGANPVPHADILDNAVKAVLAEEGWELETVVFQDYVLPNTSLEADELDANYFQTLGYMNQQNDEAGLHLAAVAGVHIEPMGIYSEKYTSLSELPDGASIGIPNDPDNEDRGLNLLVQKGLLNSKGSYGEDDGYTAQSITDDKEANPHGYVITPLEAASLPLSLPDLDAAAINGNYALGAELPSSHPALEIEEFDDETTVKRTNFIVVKQGNEETEKTKALIAAIQSDAVKQYIDENYKGSVISSFIDPE